MMKRVVNNDWRGKGKVERWKECSKRDRRGIGGIARLVKYSKARGRVAGRVRSRGKRGSKLRNEKKGDNVYVQFLFFFFKCFFIFFLSFIFLALLWISLESLLLTDEIVIKTYYLTKP